MLGQVGGPQTISLASPGCLYKGIAMHEMMHCAGFYHEQSRRDRDQHIKISFENIVSGKSNTCSKSTLPLYKGDFTPPTVKALFSQPLY